MALMEKISIDITSVGLTSARSNDKTLLFLKASELRFQLNVKNRAGDLPNSINIWKHDP